MYVIVVVNVSLTMNVQNKMNESATLQNQKTKAKMDK